jgi:Flp pilus assembly protein TadD
LEPDSVGAYNERGMAYYEKGDYDQAIVDYDQAIRLKADFEEAKQNLEIAKRR